MKNKGKYVLFVILIIVLGVIVFSLLSNKPLSFISNIFNNVNDIRNVSRENEYIKSFLTENKYVVEEKNILLKENKVLKGTLELKKHLEEDMGYEVVAGEVISRNEEDWYSYLMINKGKEDGIEENMAVATKDGLIGKIINVYESSSKVQLLSGNNEFNKVSVTSKESKNTHGIIQGYSNSDNILLVSDLKNNDENEENQVGSTIITSGLGGIYPFGIEVGKVVNKRYANYGVSVVYEVKPNTDFYDISTVLVIKNK